ncbi:multidrug efflux SMR transporter [Raineyella sp. LH-20]|uniref:DMT family transporter n=1 Tax=Raineyella sp. LH-20 TaxID=3081204 RepID=UPI0029547AE2|nr:multidrug efflux SMR transporter [Raineyella sp. LH-20]WOP20017.1 multidrug efflux SMR transporter [Raineyella sp. LH-20]
MAWVTLLVSAVLEAVWATALGRSDGLSRPVPGIVFGLALIASMVGLSRATRQIPIGTAYAVWVGVGTALTVGWAMATGAEPVSGWRLLFLGGIVAAATGLKLVPGVPRRPKVTPEAGSADVPAADVPIDGAAPRTTRTESTETTAETETDTDTDTDTGRTVRDVSAR